MARLPDHIVAFSVLTGHIVGRLFMVFPTPIELRFDEFVGKVPELASYDSGVFVHTVDWLISQKIISAEDRIVHQRDSATFYKCILTHKGFSALLKRPPSVRDASEFVDPIGQSLLLSIERSDEISKQDVSQLVLYLLH